MFPWLKEEVPKNKYSSQSINLNQNAAQRYEKNQNYHDIKNNYKSSENLYSNLYNNQDNSNENQNFQKTPRKQRYNKDQNDSDDSNNERNQTPNNKKNQQQKQDYQNQFQQNNNKQEIQRKSRQQQYNDNQEQTKNIYTGYGSRSTSQSPNFHRSNLHKQAFEPQQFSNQEDRKYPRNYADELKQQILEKERLNKIKKQEDIKLSQKAYIEQTLQMDKKTGGGAPLYDNYGNPVTKIKGVTQKHLLDYETTELGKQTAKGKQTFWGKNDKNLMDKMFDRDDMNQSEKRQKSIDFYEQNMTLDRKNSIDSDKHIKYEDNQDIGDEKNFIQLIVEKDRKEKQLQQQKRREYFDTIAQQVEDKKNEKKLRQKQELLESFKEDERIKEDLKEIARKYKEEQNKQQRTIETSSSKIKQKKKEFKEKEAMENDSKFLSQTKPSSQIMDYDDIKNKQNNDNQNEDNDNNQQNDKKNQNYQDQQEFDPDLKQMQTNYSQQGQFIQQQQQQQQAFNTQYSNNNPNNAYQLNQSYHQQNHNFGYTQYPPTMRQTQGVLRNTAGGSEQFFQVLDGNERLYKQQQELSQLNEKLQNQTSILQNEMRELKKDAILAQEKKRCALQDLEALKDELKRQEIVEQVRYREIQNQKQYQSQTQPYDYLLKNSLINSQSQSTKFIPVNEQKNMLNPFNTSGFYKSGTENKKDILDSLVESSIYTPVNNYNVMKDYMRKPNLQYKVESTIANSNPSMLDNNLQQIDNILLNLNSKN